MEKNKVNDHICNCYRIILIPASIVMLILSFFLIGNVTVEASVKNMKLPSKATLRSYVNKYTIDGKKDYYDQKANQWKETTEKNINEDLFKKADTGTKAKVFATMMNCANDNVYFVSSNKTVKKYIRQLAEAYNNSHYFLYKYIEPAEAADFFLYLAGYINVPDKKEDTVERILTELIEYYTDRTIEACNSRRQYYDYEPDYYLRSAYNVLDIFFVTDGKINQGAKYCKLLGENRISYRRQGKTVSGTRKIYLVTKPGTIKYTSYDTSTGKKTTTKHKYVSFVNAVNNEIVSRNISPDRLKEVISIDHPDSNTAQAVHERLLAGKETVLKSSCGKDETIELIDKLETYLHKINDGQGFAHEYCTLMPDSGTYVLISEKNAALYDPSSEFVEKFVKMYKKNILNWIRSEYRWIFPDNEDAWSDTFVIDPNDLGTDWYTFSNFYKDHIKYPDEKERISHVMYDFIVSEFQRYSQFGWIWGNEDYNFNPDLAHPNMIVTGYDEPTTLGYMSGFYHNMEDSDWSLKIDSSPIIRSISGTYIDIMSYSEFLNIPGFDNYYEDFCRNSSTCYLTEDEFATLRIYTDLYYSDFKELNDAQRLVAVDLSKMFECRYSNPDREMRVIYEYNKYSWDAGTRLEALQDLMDGKASGVCQVFSAYERLVFDILGLEPICCSSSAINHAFTVVRAVNSDGKVLWVPFDYGIEPSENLAVSDDIREKYLATEEMRYELYLSSITDAPKYKNFSFEDFK